jgi:Fe-Mn family superoxide dismutase
MKYTLPALPYAFGALEPYIDALTMEIHHDRHHQAYINNLNEALAKHPQTAEIPLHDLLSNLDTVPADIREAVRNNGGGTYNHTLFWTFMTPKSSQKPVGSIEKEITKTFGSLEEFQEKFNVSAKKVFGSGWAWLGINSQGNLVITHTPNQDTPLAQDIQPLLGLDVWEHAYYLKYQNKRPDYIGAWWHVVNWERVLELYEAAK